MTAKDLTLSYELYLAAPAADVWKALTDGAQTEQYFYGTRLVSSLKPGAPLQYLAGEAKMVEGEIVEIERGRRLVARQRSLWDEKVAADPASTVAWELTPMGERATRLTLVQSGFARETETYTQHAQGWPVILSSLKTLVETGKPLVLPAQA
ncbi:MAG: SRPBCC domain-containing protein [Deltaproteobacteria bacterium]|nr:SRPBCC domain-containing protein [Deltaproteobacteria bacterium]